MSNGMVKVSDYTRVTFDEDGVLVQQRQEAGRGKRFGTDGEIALEREEADRLAKIIFANQLEDW